MNFNKIKASIGLLVIFLTINILISGCQKAPINGKLDGMWEVMEVAVDDKILTPEKRVFYNFYMHVCQLTRIGGMFTDGNMIYEDKMMALDFPYVRSQSDILFLQNYGIYSNPVTFTVDFISDESLILRDGDIVVTLRKF